MKKYNYRATLTLCLLWFLCSGSAQANNNDSLFYAARAGLYSSVAHLINQGANVNYTNLSRETPMHAAASKGHLNVMQLLRSKGARHDVRTSGNWMPLHHAVRFGHVRAAQYLLHLGTPLYARTRDGKTVFDIAQATRNQAMIHFLDNFRRNRR